LILKRIPQRVVFFKYVILQHLKKSDKYGIVFNRRKIFLATIGERGVMKTKIFGLALMLSLAAILGACEGGGEGGGGTTSTPAATGEPTDAPPATPPATPAATPTATPK
jgi:hypothetical protein